MKDSEELKDEQQVEEKRRDIRGIFERIVNSPQEEARAARKELKGVYELRQDKQDKKVFSKDFQGEIIAKHGEVESPVNRALYLGALGDVYFDMRKEAENLFEIVLQEIINSSGQVRKAALNLSQHAWMVLDMEKNNEEAMQEYRRDVLLRIKKLIDQYAPSYVSKSSASEPIVITKLSPSIFKSLLYLWHIFAYRGTAARQLLERYPEVDLVFSVQWYDDHDEEEDSREPNEVAEEVWQKSQPAEKVDEHLQKLENNVKARVDFFLSEIGKKEESKRLHSKMEQSKNIDEEVEVIETFFYKIAGQFSTENYNSKEICETSRLLYSYLENSVFYTSEKRPYSFILTTAYQNIPKSREKRILELPRLLQKTHNILDDFIDKKVEENKRLSKTVEKYAGSESGIETDFFDQMIELLSEGRSIGHYTLDQYAQFLPEDFLKKAPERVTAVALDAIYRFNMDDYIPRLPPFNRQDTTHLGGWKSYIGGSSSNVYNVLKQNVLSPTLLLLSSIGTIDKEEMGGEKEEDDDSLKNIDENSIATQIGTPPYQLDPKELEYRIQILFDRYNIADKVTVEGVKKYVYESRGELSESSQNFDDWFVSLFPDRALQSEESYYEIMGSAVDAWNAFPHADLQGKSPLEKVQELAQDEE